jgi:hypothetical protein
MADGSSSGLGHSLSCTKIMLFDRGVEKVESAQKRPKKVRALVLGSLLSVCIVAFTPLQAWAADPGCTTAYPTITAVQSPYNAWITACQNARRDLFVKNVTSASVLYVTVLSGTASFKIGKPPTDTLAQRSVALAVPSVEDPPRGVVVPPGVTLEAIATSPDGAAIEVVVDQGLSAKAVAAAALAEFAEQKFGSRAYRLREGLADCGRNAGEFADRAANSVPELLRATLGTGTACASLLQEFDHGSPESVADDAVRAAEQSTTLKASQWRNFFSSAARTAMKFFS